ncbi:MAG: hypothetical protein JNG85_03695 [Spirochaetaceae bacterium]|nr:hypothetical protein [Spirochaetaceae bacterium]
MSRKELETVLDYILNRADDAEFEVLLKACERRKRDKSMLGKIGGLGPSESARRAAADIQGQMGYSLDGIRSMVKDFVGDIIRKNAPEIGEDELRALLEAYVPDPAKAEARAREAGTARSPLPPEAILKMAEQFIEYSEGAMAPSRQRELWEEMPRWQDAYWQAFPPEVKLLVKAYLEGKLSVEEYGKAIVSILEL